jgi:hypothetical protein
MSNIINVLYVLVAVIGVIYVAPYLIALIASGWVSNTKSTKTYAKEFLARI